jgi:hypothetical protein
MESMFPAFPDFIPLSLELKENYNRLVGDFTPYSDISFATLQTWWNLSEELAVSLLNGNLVINYQLPFDADNSGLGLVGKNHIEASIRVIFEYLKQADRKVQLVHVPEFVLEQIKDKSEFDIQEEPDYNEYILDSHALAQLEGHDYQLLRKKIRRFTREVGERPLEIKDLDLSLTEVQDQLFQSIAEWAKDSPNNDPDNTEHLAHQKVMSHAAALDIKSLALYIDHELHGIMIYHQPLGKEYYVLHHLKVNYETPYISDYIHHKMAEQAVKNNVTKLNIEMDLGIENLRKHKQTLRPAEMLRKYTLKPIASD